MQTGPDLYRLPPRLDLARDHRDWQCRETMAAPNPASDDTFIRLGSAGPRVEKMELIRQKLPKPAAPRMGRCRRQRIISVDLGASEISTGE